MAKTRRPILDIPVTELKDDGRSAVSDHVLALTGTYRRFGVGGICRGGEGRQTYQGPMIPGPWAFAFGLGSTITANPAHGTGAERERKLAAGTEHDVAEGDRVRFDGVTYEVQVTNGFGVRGPVGRGFDFIRLTPVTKGGGK
jgi:hypothetical protein